MSIAKRSLAKRSTARGRSIRPLIFAHIVLTAVLTTFPVLGGGQLDTFDFTGSEPGPIPGTVVGELVPIQWDSRCLPIHYVVNTAVAPNTIPPLDATATAAEMQASQDPWNDIPTSFVEMTMVGEVFRELSNPFDLVAFDFINEVNFLSGNNGEGFLAASPSVSLTVDSDFTVGLDIDGDGDSDVFDPTVAGVSHCTDIDGDGDIEFPAGQYAAGTMLDNDVTFNNTVVTWTVGEPNDVPGQLDLQSVAVHEFGHSHGLAHTSLDRSGPEDGRAPSMRPGSTRTNDPTSQLARRELGDDDIAWSSFVYPEGSATEGPAALQADDVAFDEVFGVLRGDITHGASGLPLVGGSVFASDVGDGSIVASHYTGRARVLLDPLVGLITLQDNPEFHLVDGSYSLPVPDGSYHLTLEALDSAPLSAFAISRTAPFGLTFGLLDFNEQLFGKFDPTFRNEPRKVKVKAGKETTGVDHVTQVDLEIDGFDLVGLNAAFDLDGIAFFGAPPGLYYAVQIPADEVLEVMDQGLVATGAAFRNFQISDTTQVIRYDRAVLTTGRVVGDTAVLDLQRPLLEEPLFMAQQNDYSPWFFRKPAKLAREIRRAIDDGAGDLFLVLKLPDAFPDPTQDFPAFVGFDIGQEIGLLGRTFVSSDGESFGQNPFVNLMFRLILTTPGH